MAMEYDLSDIRAATANDGMFGGNGGIWALLLLFLFAGNGFGFGGRGQAATTEEVAAGFNFQGINSKLNELTAGQAGINQNLSNAICTSTYELASKIDQCCCNTQLGIQGVKFDMANYAAGTNAAIAEQTQKVLDAISGNRMADMQNQINQLQLQAALCGVIRYPTATTYAVPSTCFGTCNTACAY